MMRSFEKKLLGASEDGIEDDQSESDDTPTYKGIWDDNSPTTLPEQIESDQE